MDIIVFYAYIVFCDSLEVLKIDPENNGVYLFYNALPNKNSMIHLGIYILFIKKKILKQNSQS